MELTPNKAVSITLATLALHNMLRVKGQEVYLDEDGLDVENEDDSIEAGSWRTANTGHVQNIPKGKRNHPKISAENIRDAFADHFYGSGAIPWQWNVLL